MEDRIEFVNKLLKQYPELRTLSKEEKKDFISTFTHELFINDFINDFDFDKVLAEYLLLQKEEYKKIIESCISNFHYFLDQHGIYISDIIFDTVYLYQLELEKQGKTKASINVINNRLANFFDFLIQKYPEIFKDNYFRYLRIYDEKTVSNNSIIPTADEIDYIINNVPTKDGAFIAVLCYKGYSHIDAVNVTLDWESSFGNIDEFAYAFLDQSEYNYENWDPDDLSYDEFRELQELHNPTWYKTILSDLWNENPGLKKPFQDINPRSFENKLAKYMKQFVEAGGITKPYTVKSFRWFAIKNMYEESHNLSAIQKVLHHSTPSITKKYLLNIGIKVD